jgi:hypothetical protein
MNPIGIIDSILLPTEHPEDTEFRKGFGATLQGFNSSVYSVGKNGLGINGIERRRPSRGRSRSTPRRTPKPFEQKITKETKARGADEAFVLFVAFCSN